MYIVFLLFVASCSAQYLPNGCPSDFSVHLLLPHETDCDKFYQCSNGQKILKQCPSATLFDNDLQVCNWPNAVDCSRWVTQTTEYVATKYPVTTDSIKTDYVTEDPTATGSASTKPVTTESGANHTANITSPDLTTDVTASTKIDVECPPDSTATILLPHETDCSKYYACSNGYKILMSCASGTFFDFNAQVCDWPQKVTCATTATTESLVTVVETETETLTEKATIKYSTPVVNYSTADTTRYDYTNEPDITSTEESVGTNDPTPDIITLTDDYETSATSKVTTTKGHGTVPTATTEYSTASITTSDKQTATDQVTENIKTTSKLEITTTNEEKQDTTTGHNLSTDIITTTIKSPEESDRTTTLAQITTDLDKSSSVHEIPELQTTTELLRTTNTVFSTTENKQSTESELSTTESLQTTSNYESTTFSEPKTTESLESTTSNIHTTEELVTITDNFSTEIYDTTTQLLEVTGDDAEKTTKLPEVCPEGHYGNVPHPELCDSFYMCANGVAIQLYCSKDLEYDPSLGYCVPVSSNGCTASKVTSTTDNITTIYDSTTISGASTHHVTDISTDQTHTLTTEATDWTLSTDENNTTSEGPASTTFKIEETTSNTKYESTLTTSKETVPEDTTKVSQTTTETVHTIEYSTTENPKITSDILTTLENSQTDSTQSTVGEMSTSAQPVTDNVLSTTLQTKTTIGEENLPSNPSQTTEDTINTLSTIINTVETSSEIYTTSLRE
ncbi:unnamed protein product [Parnassius apollo]|uniref:(apollo) hypothetical protein n=1 Tax=Parnassius apollo TaxID=110799 RepID=A0A8S3YA63_PARAO|nr:unnamed protein product [Parnassius apollo]